LAVHLSPVLLLSATIILFSYASIVNIYWLFRELIIFTLLFYQAAILDSLLFPIYFRIISYMPKL
jgi:hypothetical protein